MTRVREGQMRMDTWFGEGRTGRLQWYASNRVPSLVSRAAKAGGYSSNAEYIRTAILAALVRDLGEESLESLLAEQPHKSANPLYSNPSAYSTPDLIDKVV